MALNTVSLADKMLVAKGLLSPTPKDTAYVEAYKMALSYEYYLGIYRHDPTLKYINKKTFENPKHLSKWKKAVEFASEMSVDFDVYVKAQFWVFDQWFKRAPTPSELASYQSKIPSKERVKIYLLAIASGKADPAKDVCYNAIPSRLDMIKQSVKDINCSNQLRQLAKNYEIAEVAILTLLIKNNNAHLFFDPVWVQNHPVYKQLKSNGEI